jgi:hypothetical protein
MLRNTLGTKKIQHPMHGGPPSKETKDNTYMDP